ncbi:helix-turn-helix domain-containing protein [Sphingomonas ginkgonis]|uniref:helix-turn-helix domain-containing protein n=1 Tax=Sphingomonas ginkgonis TaxID=2315330 RepID=UPI00163B58C1|nr:helix-turn-helix transcriptional regulator [Sphingomonas ginkgonis]
MQERAILRDVERAQARTRVDRLNEGQRACLRLVAEHLSSKEIAARLGISPHTVDQRIRLALPILGVTRRSEAARLVALAETGAYQRLIYQAPDIPADADPAETDEAVGFQIRHADGAGRDGSFGLDTEQGTGNARPSLVLPIATRTNPRNEMSVAARLMWIVLIAIGSAFSAGMYLAGLESLSRLLGQ